VAADKLRVVPEVGRSSSSSSKRCAAVAQ
jgi:hypothetical protein